MKSKKVVLLALALTQLFGFKAKSQGINFITGQTWESIKAKAKQENKYIFLDMYTTWCGPCKYMDKEVYSAASAGEFFNSSFISVKVQLDSLASDESNIKTWYKTAKELRQVYNVTTFPSLIFLNPSGEMVSKQTGAVSVETLISFGKEASNPDTQYIILLSRYNQGKRDPSFIRNLIRLAFQVGEKAKSRQIALNYINGLKDNELLELENIWCVYENTKSSNDRGFAFFRDNAEEIHKVEPKMESKYLQAKLYAIIDEEAIKPYSKSLSGSPDWKKIDSALTKFGADGKNVLASKKHDIIFDSEILPVLKTSTRWRDVNRKIEQCDNKLLREQLFRLTAFYYLNAAAAGKLKIYDVLIPAVDQFMEQDTTLTAEFINQVCWTMFDKIQEKNDLKAVMKWAKIGLNKAPDFANLNDTYANLLYKSGKKKEALVWEAKAVKLDPNNFFGIKENYEKMQLDLPTWTVVKP